MDTPGEVDCRNHLVTCLCGIAVNHRIKPCGAEDGDIDHAVWCIGMEVPPDDRHAELGGGVMHSLDDHFLCGVL